MHITASVLINDGEASPHHDHDALVEKIAPREPASRYTHGGTGEGHTGAPIKRHVLGREVVVAVTEGQLIFDTWEQIFYREFNRRKRVCIRNMRGVNSTTLG